MMYFSLFDIVKDKLLIYLEGEKIDRTVLLGKTPEIR
jgi:hypothetical protein